MRPESLGTMEDFRDQTTMRMNTFNLNDGRWGRDKSRRNVKTNFVVLHVHLPSQRLSRSRERPSRARASTAGVLGVTGVLPALLWAASAAAGAAALAWLVC